MIRTRVGSRRVVALAGVVAVALLSFPASARAAAPERVSLDVSEPAVLDEGLEEACGAPVSVSATGTVEVTLWRNGAGLVTRERDRFPKAWRTFTAVETGESFRVRLAAVSTWDYGAGARVGSPVTIKETGLVFHIPGATAIAGHVVSEGGVVDHFEQGVPIVENGGEVVRRVGHFPDDVDFAAAICKALHL